MENEGLTAKELALIEVLGHQNNSQRSIARTSGFSLGMTNLLLKRLIAKGYVKVASLNGRTLKYMLTPSGFAEKVRRSYEYVVTSIRNLNEIKQMIQKVVSEHDGGDENRVIILGKNELAALAREALRDVSIQAEFWTGLEPDELFAGKFPSIVLHCDMDVDAGEFENRPGVTLVRLDRLVKA